MKLELKYEKEEDIPEGFKDLYKQDGDVWMFDAIDGLKTQADIDEVKDALAKERDRTREVEKLYAPFKELEQSTDDIKAITAENEALKTKLDAAIDATNKGEAFDQAKIDKMVEDLVEQKIKAEVTMETAWRDNKLNELNGKLTDLTGENDSLKGDLRQTQIKNAIRNAMVEAKVKPDVMGDAALLFESFFDIRDDGSIQTVRQGNGQVTPGLEPGRFFELQKTERPWLWGETVGANAKGSNGSARFEKNPFHPDTVNLTEQGQIIRQDKIDGTDIAQQMRAAAGVKTNGGRQSAAA